MTSYFLVHIEPSNDELGQTYHLFTDDKLAWIFLEDWAKRGWKKTYGVRCPVEYLTKDEIHEYFDDANEYLHLEEIDLETEWKSQPTLK